MVGEKQALPPFTTRRDNWAVTLESSLAALSTTSLPLANPSFSGLFPQEKKGPVPTLGCILERWLALQEEPQLRAPLGLPPSHRIAGH